MESVKIALSSIDKVKAFVGIITQFEGDFDLSSKRYKVDAKSIMGIFSMDLSETLQLDIHEDAESADVKAKLKDFIV